MLNAYEQSFGKERQIKLLFVAYPNPGHFDLSLPVQIEVVWCEVWWCEAENKLGEKNHRGGSYSVRPVWELTMTWVVMSEVKERTQRCAWSASQKKLILGKTELKKNNPCTQKLFTYFSCICPIKKSCLLTNPAGPLSMYCHPYCCWSYKHSIMGLILKNTEPKHNWGLPFPFPLLERYKNMSIFMVVKWIPHGENCCCSADGSLQEQCPNYVPLESEELYSKAYFSEH